MGIPRPGEGADDDSAAQSRAYKEDKGEKKRKRHYEQHSRLASNGTKQSREKSE